MKPQHIVWILASCLIAACASTPPTTQTSAAGPAWIAPEQAVMMAAEAAPEGVTGTFVMTVRGSGRQHNRTFLNSQSDYRDQRCLTIALSPVAAQQLALRLGQPAEVALAGKDISVRGVAVRTKIYLYANGNATEKYYYQTHVNVTDADQITVR